MTGPLAVEARCRTIWQYGDEEGRCDHKSGSHQGHKGVCTWCPCRKYSP